MDPDTRLNHYRIVAPLGEGGMGQVYRAEDTRLKRQVAIKVLPAELAADPERLARLEREAQLLAQLEHPNVAAVYGLEEADGTRYLVMQLVEGETLADRIADGAVPVESAMSIGLQVAEGLEAAHERGIVHRDLKPGNVMVSADGAVKILDFGLAKAGDLAASGVGTGGDLTASPTMMAPTQAGMILGTAAYMSPEQARGRPVDKRTDIWAFGCVLYEMLTGSQGFGGETVTDILAAIVHKEPELEALPEDTPWRVRELIERCLVKDPVQRVRDIGDARIALQRAIAEPAPGAAPGTAAESPAGAAVTFGWVWRGLVTVGVIVAAALAVFAWRGGGPADAPVRRFALHTDMAIDVRDRTPRLSPEGTRVVFYADGQLWIRHLSQTEARPLEGTREALFPIWSPDGEHIAFFAEETLWRMPAAGGDRTRLTSVGEVEDAYWAPDGRIYFGLDPDIAVVSDQGGDPRVIIEIDDLPADPGDGGLDLHEPFLLPDGRSILYRYHTVRDAGSIMVWDGDSSRRLMRGGTRELLRAPVYSRTGHILYERLGVDNPGLWAVPFDADALSLTGEAFLVEPGTSGLTLGPRGDALVVQGGIEELFELTWVGLDGTLGEALGPAFNAGPFRLALSPEGDRVVIARNAGEGSDLWVVDDRGGMIRLTSHPGRELYPAWDLARGRIVYTVGVGEQPPELWAQSLDGTGAPERIVEGFRGHVSADGRLLVFERRDSPTAPGDLWMLDLDGVGDPIRLLESPHGESDAAVSPDGQVIAFVSDESGQPEIHVRSLPDGGDRRVVSTAGGTGPEWSPDGRRLFFISNQELMVVDRDPGHGFGAPRRLLSARMPGLSSTYFNDVLGFGIAPEGDRVLVPARVPDREPPRLVLVQNWLSQLRGR